MRGEPGNEASFEDLDKLHHLYENNVLNCAEFEEQKEAIEEHLLCLATRTWNHNDTVMSLNLETLTQVAK